MAANAPPKTKRETWQDWLPDVEPTLTIDDVIARLQERGIDDVTVENIRLWQRENVLPAPIRRRISTGRGGSHAIYPPEVVEAITQIRALQDTGVRLRDMRSHLARMFGLNRGPIDHPLQATITGTSKMTGDLTTTSPGNVVLSGETTEVTTHTRTVPQSATVSVNDPALLVAVKAAAKRQEQRTGAPIRQVAVTFTDTHGKEHSHTFILETRS